MNFSLYLLGTPEGRYSQYPDDYTASTLAGLQGETVGAQLVIYREMDLVHYAYTERLGNNKIIGFCLIFNKVRIRRPTQLIGLFRLIIEKLFVESGDIIKYSEDGELRFRVKAMNECIKEYGRLKEYINSEFENNVSKYEIEPLSTVYDGIKSTGELGMNASDEQIISMTKQHNMVIVSDDCGIENSYIPKIISSLREQNQKSKEEIRRLADKNASLERKKKQYVFVMLLAFLLLGCGVGLFFLNDNLNSTKDELAQAYETVINKDNEILNLSSTNQELNANLHTEKTRRLRAEDNLKTLRNSISDRYPFIVKSTSYEFSSGYLTIDYYGITEGTYDIQLRAYKENSNSCNSRTVSFNVYEGYNTTKFYISSSFDGSVWYAFVILKGNAILGGSRH